MSFKVVKSLSISFLFIGVFVSTSFSQQNSIIKGIILNAESKNPVPFATVAFQDRSFGVISNEDGSFTLPISISDSIKQIEISCIGYRSILFGLQSIGLDKIQTFRLTPISYDIDEVEVQTKRQRGKSASEIVTHAVRRISANYPNFPFLLDGYYRDYLKIDDSYLNLFEAAVQLQDNGFNTVEKEQTRIGLSFGAINRSFPIDSNMITNYGNHKIIPYGQTGYTGGNEFYFLLVHNPVRNYLNESFAFIKRIQHEFLDDHRFTLLGTEYIDSVLCYKLQINYTKSEQPEFATGSIGGGSKRFRENYKAVGNIYIQADNFRIHNLSYQVFYRKLRLWELNVSYKDLAGVFYLNYLSFNNLVETPNYLDEHYFYLKNISIDKNTKQVNLFFNNPVDSESVDKYRKFRLRFDGNRIKVSNVEVADTCVTLSVEDFERSLGSFELKHSDRLDIDVRAIRDIHGNKINDIETTRAYQYREFFVNNASTDFEPIPNDRLLDRDVSIILMEKSDHMLPDSVKFNSPLIGRD